MKVLLYNFFEDSPVDLSQWRVILNALPEVEKNSQPAPRFDDARHNGVCREVKRCVFMYSRLLTNLRIRLVAKISICRHYKSAKESVDSRLFQQERTHEGDFPQFS